MISFEDAPAVARESVGRINCAALAAGHQKRITRSRASVNPSATVRTAETSAQDTERRMHNPSGHGTTFHCCNKTFASERNMKIHQAKKCRKKVASQQRRSPDRQTSGSTQQETNHSVSQTAAGTDRVQMEVAEKKPKINWPRASDTVKYRQFDDTMSEAVSRLRGKPEWKLERTAEMLYEEAKDRFGLEKSASGKSGSEGSEKKGGPSRRERKIAEVRREKKRLRKRWAQAEEREKAGLKALYEEIKKKHRELLREQRRVERKKEVKDTRKKFLDDPYKFAKGLFTDSKGASWSVRKRSWRATLLRPTMMDGETKSSSSQAVDCSGQQYQELTLT